MTLNLRRAAGLLAVAALVHVATLWALPRLIMARLSMAAPPEQKLGVYLPPMTDETQRRIVMPSPDLLYATCAFDLRAQPLRIRADPRSAGHQAYWSIALYASNSDNFFVLNDRQTGTRPVDLLLIHRDTPARPHPAGASVVRSPSSRGLLLLRVLVADYAAEREVVEAARKTLRCEPLT